MNEISWAALAILFTVLWGPESADYALSDLSSLYCLSANTYHEARGESYREQVAVSQVVLNRVADSRWPDTVCSVVTQENQFSWYWDTRPDTIHDLKAFRENVYAAVATYAGQTNDITEGATNYYAHDLIDPPAWAKDMAVTLKLEGHTYLK